LNKIYNGSLGLEFEQNFHKKTKTNHHLLKPQAFRPYQPPSKKLINLAFVQALNIKRKNSAISGNKKNIFIQTNISNNNR